MKSQAQVIDFFRELGIYVDDTTSKKYNNTCLFANMELQFRVNGKLYTIPCKDIDLKVNESGFLKRVTLKGEDIEYDEEKDKMETEKQLEEFEALLGGY